MYRSNINHSIDESQSIPYYTTDYDFEPYNDSYEVLCHICEGLHGNNSLCQMNDCDFYGEE